MAFEDKLKGKRRPGALYKVISQKHMAQSKPTAIPVANVPAASPKMGMRMEMGGPGIRPELQLRLVLTPQAPVAYEDYQVKNHGLESVRGLSDDVLNEIEKYVMSENIKSPYKDLQIRDYLREKGYELGLRSIVLAREKLGIKPYSQRLME